MSWIG